MASSVATGAGARRTQILLVEDEPAARQASEIYLTHCGYEVETAASVSAAIERAAARTPDLLVCDWRLGAGGNGVDVARELRARYNTPVIFVSAHPLDELREQTADLDVTGYFAKPVSLPKLAAAIARVAA